MSHKLHIQTKILHHQPRKSQSNKHVGAGSVVQERIKIQTETMTGTDTGETYADRQSAEERDTLWSCVLVPRGPQSACFAFIMVKSWGSPAVAFDKTLAQWMVNSTCHQGRKGKCCPYYS